MQELKSELTAMLDEAEWSWIMPHAQRDAVVVVSPQLDLVEVGAAIASDNTDAVQQWIGASLLQKPSPDQLIDWGRDRTKRFHTLIVQPYVLVQDSVSSD